MHELPRLFDRIAPHEERLVADDHVVEQSLVRFRRRSHVMEIDFDLLQLGRRPGHLRHDMQREALVRLNPYREHVGRQRCAWICVIQNSGHVVEVDRNLARALGHPLAGAQVERHSRPSPVVDPASQRDESLDLRIRRDVLLFAVRFDRHPADQSFAVLAAHDPFLEVIVAERTQRTQHVELRIAHRLGTGGIGRLGRDHAKRLQQMALHHVAQRARVIVVGGARADALGLSDGYLHMIDEARRPDRFEDRVGESQHHQVLDRLLAEVVIDSENLAFIEMAREFGVDFRRAGEIGADRFFDHDPRERLAPAGRMNHARRGQSFRTGVDEGRRNREVEGAIAFGAALLVDRLASFAQVLVVRRFGERAAIEMQHRRELRPVFFIDRAARELLDTAERERAVLLVVEILHRETENRELVGQFAVERQVVQRRYQLATTQVAGATEDHDDARLVVIAFLNRMQMIEINASICAHSHKNLLPVLAHYSLTTPCPPNSSRSAASNFSPKVPSPLSARDRKRVNSAIVITGIEMFLSIASCTAQRPSPESST